MAIREQLILIAGEEEYQDCISCCEPTLNITMCCKAAICKSCYQRWLETKRTCMHCNKDQTSFDTWYANFRQEPEYDPREFIDNLAEMLGSEGIHQQINLEPPQDLSEILELLESGDDALLTDLDLEFGFTLPNGQTWQHSVSLNPDHNLDSQQVLEELQGVMDAYSGLFRQFMM